MGPRPRARHQGTRDRPKFEKARGTAAWARHGRLDDVAVLKQYTSPISLVSIRSPSWYGLAAFRKARRYAAKIAELGRTHYVSSMELARDSAAVGERDRAIDLIEKVVESRAEPGIIGLEVDPGFDFLRNRLDFRRF